MVAKQQSYNYPGTIIGISSRPTCLCKIQYTDFAANGLCQFTCSYDNAAEFLCVSMESFQVGPGRKG